VNRGKRKKNVHAKCFCLHLGSDCSLGCCFIFCLFRGVKPLHAVVVGVEIGSYLFVVVFFFVLCVVVHTW
jgi:hypothetical protein